MKKNIIFAFAAIAFLLMVQTDAAAQALGVSVNVEELTADSSGDGWQYFSSSNVLKFTGGYNYTVSGSNDALCIVVDPNNKTMPVNMAIDNLKIIHGDDTCQAFGIAKGSQLNLTLRGDNVLKSGGSTSDAGRAGLSVPGGTDEFNADGATLTITADSTGRLAAFGGRLSAGIGGDSTNPFGGIMICGGTVHAYGGLGGAGIGGGYCKDGFAITISGGTVVSGGGVGSAGIGGGYYSTGCGDILITNATVTATGNGDVYTGGAGIGMGVQSGTSVQGSVTIEAGSYVIANGALNAAGIGGGASEGKDSDGENNRSGVPWIEIYGGIVTATGTGGGAGIGGGAGNTTMDSDGNYLTWEQSGILIMGGSVKASGFTGIGDGDGGSDYWHAAYYDENSGWNDVYLIQSNDTGDYLPAGGVAEIAVVDDNDSPLYTYSYDGRKHQNDANCYLYLPAKNNDHVFSLGNATCYCTIQDQYNISFRIEGTVSEEFGVSVNGTDISSLSGGTSTNMWNYDSAHKILNLTSPNGEYTVSGSSTNLQLRFGGDGCRPIVTLSNLNLDASGIPDGKAAHMDNGIGPTFILDGSNSLKSASGYPGISVFGEVTIKSGTEGYLFVEGSAGAAAVGGDSSGQNSVGKINIESGNVFANALAGGGAAIGAGKENKEQSDFDISISGGNVIAESGNGAGIGMGSDGLGTADILISGGNVTARGGSMNPGIGAARGCRNGTVNIDISGGTNNVTGGAAGDTQMANCSGAGLGAAAGSMNVNLKIRKGNVYAVSGSESIANLTVPGIGAPQTSRSTKPYTGTMTITISGYPHILQLGSSSNYYDGKNWTFGSTGSGNESALSQLRDFCNKVQNYRYANVEFLFEQSGVVVNDDDILSGGKYDYGWVYDSQNKTLLLNGVQPITMSGTASNITVAVGTNATVNATISDFTVESLDKSKEFIALNIPSSSTLNLSMVGNNSFTGGGKGAGIYVPEGAVLNITTNGGYGTLTAIGGGSGGAGIGGTASSYAGFNPNCGTVNIFGGTVEAVGKAGSWWQAYSGGAGIGGGVGGNGGTVMITGGSVRAEKSSYVAKPIGRGTSGDSDGTLSNGEAGGNQEVWQVSLPVCAEIDIQVTNSLNYTYTYKGPGHGDGYIYLYLPNGSYNFTSGINEFDFTVHNASCTPEYTTSLNIAIKSISLDTGKFIVEYDTLSGGQPVDFALLGAAGSLHLLKASSPFGPWTEDASVAFVPVEEDGGVLEYTPAAGDTSAFFRVWYKRPGGTEQ